MRLLATDPQVGSCFGRASSKSNSINFRLAFFFPGNFPTIGQTETRVAGRLVRLPSLGHARPVLAPQPHFGAYILEI